MSELKPAPRRVQEAADRLGLPVRVVEMAQSTRTAEEAATACGCAVGQIIKSLVFRGKESGRPVLLLVSGANRVDQKGVAASIGEALDRPDADVRTRCHRLRHRRHPAVRPCATAADVDRSGLVEVRDGLGGGRIARSRL